MTCQALGPGNPASRKMMTNDNLRLERTEAQRSTIVQQEHHITLRDIDISK